MKEQIKATSVAFNEQGSMYVVDTRGRIWVKYKINGEWSQVELPELEVPRAEIGFME